jgi:1-acyl-sn-glycerol-3-phosphate acyltransferase
MKDALSRPFVVLWKIWFFLIFLLSGLIFFFIFKYQLKRGKRKGALKLLRIWSIVVQRLTGLVLIRKGNVEFPPPPYIVISNHSSYLDIVLMFSIIPDYFAFLGKAELENWPIVKIFFKYGMQIPVPRASRKGSAEAYKRSSDALKQGTSLVIFPEGTIPDHVPRMKKFKSGAFRLAIENQVPIVPLSFPKNYRRILNGGFLKAYASPGPAPVIFHEVVNTTGMTEEDIIPLRDRMYSVIEKELDHGN